MNFLEELQHRGMIQDMSPGLEEHLASNKPVTAYIGFDPTAPSLTIGNYVPIMLLKLFQLSGHQPIMLFGGATGRIGDPSGKSAERQLKSADEINENLNRQKAQAEALLAPPDGTLPVRFVDNYDFYKDMNALDFLRNLGKTLTINYMMSKDSVKNRIESGLSFTEFSYQLLQGYDFERLYQTQGCTLQMGGSDQWGNITSGLEFVRKNLGAKCFGLTAPLLTKADGSKFGKSEKGNIWLDPQLTSPYQFYQFWINADDRDLPRYIKTFSLKPREEFDAMLQLAESDPRQVKADLAEELTTRIHGEEQFRSAQAVSELLFGRKASVEQLQAMNPQQLAIIAEEIPSVRLPASLLQSGLALVELLADHCQMQSSRSEARRSISSNAISVNKLKIADLEHHVQSSDLLHQRYLMIEVGKKDKRIVDFSAS